MNMQKFFIRLAVVLLSVVALDCLWAVLPPTFLLGAILIPAMVPVWVAVFANLPILQEFKNEKA
jgi:hypothetical protein